MLHFHVTPPPQRCYTSMLHLPPKMLHFHVTPPPKDVTLPCYTSPQRCYTSMLHLPPKMLHFHVTPPPKDVTLPCYTSPQRCYTSMLHLPPKDVTLPCYTSPLKMENLALEPTRSQSAPYEKCNGRRSCTTGILIQSSFVFQGTFFNKNSHCNLFI